MVTSTATATRTDAPGVRYRILGLLGKGGFGKVYRARMEGPGGFSKDVAIKILSGENHHPEVLTRFRDEARILGRVRDRNVVTVEPPLRIGDTWAVVMEYAEGCDCDQLLAVHGRIPARVALEIVGEIARTLDNLWNHNDEDGTPLRLLHRDLKPANIKVGPTGEVKLLDFGVAHADFSTRETRESQFLTGTIGYIAPERLDGVEDHKGDIYSLGVVLEELLSGHSPNAEGSPTRVSKGSRNALELAERMRAVEASKRPTAARVEVLCQELGDQLTGPGLREWSRGHVMSYVLQDDPLNGQVLHAHGTAPTTNYMWPAIASLLGAGVVVAGVVVGVLLNRELARPPSPDVGISGEVAISEPAAPPEPEPAMMLGPVEGGEEPEAVAAPPSSAVPPSPVSEPVVKVPPSNPVAPEALEELLDRDAGEPEPAPRIAMQARGTVRVSGDHDDVRLLGAAGNLAPGVVPPGDYEVRATFGETIVRSHNLTVPPNGVVELRCVRRFMRCTSSD